MSDLTIEGSPVCRRSLGRIAAIGDNGDRTISYIFSDASVARDEHTIANDGWELGNFLANPVFLWCHDSSAPPIGKAVDVAKSPAALRGTIEYAERDVYPFADTIFRLTKGGFLNAVSVSWAPIEWTRSTDRNRPGGIDFKRQELLEISAVPVPTLPTALATARAAGIDTSPLYEWAERILDGAPGGLVFPRKELEALRREAKIRAIQRGSRALQADWKCGASRELPIDETSEWDGAAAETSIFDACGFDGDSPDIEKARTAFLAYDASAPKLKGSYKLPFAKIADGKMTAVASGIRNAASRLPQTKDLPETAQKEARAVLDTYEAKMTDGDNKNGKHAFASLRRHALKRGLYEVAEMCWHIECLEWLWEEIDAEADQENDDSPIPGRFRAWINEGNLILAAMAAEETQENIQGGAAPEDLEDAVERGVARALAKIDLMRAGKTLSADNERALEDIHDRMEETRGMIRSFIDSAKAGDAVAASADGGAEERKRRAAAMRVLSNRAG